MIQKILIVGDKPKWITDVKNSLSNSQVSLSVEATDEISQCHRLLKNNSFRALFLDPDVSAGDGVEVLKLVKLNHPSIRVALVYTGAEQEKRFSEIRDVLPDLGIFDTFTLPVQAFDFLDQPLAPKRRQESESTVDHFLKEKDFTAIEIESFYQSNLTIFDYYIRIKEGYFIKIIRKDDKIDTARIRAYQSKGVKHLYIAVGDRRAYIKKLNQTLRSRIEQSKGKSAQELFALTSEIADKVLQEIHYRGLNEENIGMCKSLCDNVVNLIKTSEGLQGVNAVFGEMSYQSLSHSVLVSFLSVAMARNVSWATKKSIDYVAMGGMLHDIGMMLLPPEIRSKDPETLTEEERSLLEEHPLRGADLLLNSPGIPQQVTQIVYQHHENNLGTGYPNRMPSAKILPLAKMVSLAEKLAEIMQEEMLTPKEAIRALINDKRTLLLYEEDFIKALMTSFGK